MPTEPHSALISLNVILCEKVLLENDKIYSAIRIVDVFYFRRTPQLEPIPISVLVMGKVRPEDKSRHSAQLVLVRPNGEKTPMGPPLEAVFESWMKDESLLVEGSNVSDIAGGFSILAQVGIGPRQVGRHHIDVVLDGELVAHVPFTILELKSTTDS